MSAYAKGTYAIGLCGQCDFQFPLKNLRSDGETPNLLVCYTCWDRKNEAEYPENLTDATALYHPAPDLDAAASRVIADDTPIGELFFTDGLFFGEKS